MCATFNTSCIHHTHYTQCLQEISVTDHSVASNLRLNIEDLLNLGKRLKDYLVKEETLFGKTRTVKGYRMVMRVIELMKLVIYTNIVKDDIDEESKQNFLAVVECIQKNMF